MQWAYMDHLLGRLFDHLAAQGLAANTMVLFAADHGEDLDGIHPIHRTDSYYQTAIAVPFFAVVPERPRQRLGAGWGQWRRNAQMRVALADLVPTALDLLVLSADSLVGRVAEATGWPLAPASARSRAPDRGGHTDEHVQWSRKGYAVVAGDWKYINYSWRGSVLFDLATDALEQRDLLAGGESALSRAGRQRHLRRVRALVAKTAGAGQYPRGVLKFAAGPFPIHLPDHLESRLGTLGWAGAHGITYRGFWTGAFLSFFLAIGAPYANTAMHATFMAWDFNTPGAIFLFWSSSAC